MWTFLWKAELICLRSERWKCLRFSYLLNLFFFIGKCDKISVSLFFLEEIIRLFLKAIWSIFMALMDQGVATCRYIRTCHEERAACGKLPCLISQLINYLLLWPLQNRYKLISQNTIWSLKKKWTNFALSNDSDWPLVLRTELWQEQKRNGNNNDSGNRTRATTAYHSAEGPTVRETEKERRRAREWREKIVFASKINLHAFAL